MMKNNWNGFNQTGILIAFEGISGAGKSESINQLKKHLNDKGLDTITVEWNSNESIRKIVKTLNRMKLLTARIYSVFQWISFAIDYFTKIKPMLRKKKIIIADRYVYTALTRDIANGAGEKLSKFMLKRFREPDILFFCNTDPNVCLERIHKRGKKLFHTNKSLHKNTEIQDKELYYITKISQEYVKILADNNLMKDTNIVYINGNSDKIMKVVDMYLDNNKRSFHEQIIDFREE